MGMIRIPKKSISPYSVICDGIAAAFKQLMEEKHLYQSITLDSAEIIGEAVKYEQGRGMGSVCVPEEYKIEMHRWVTRFKDSAAEARPLGGGLQYWFRMPNINTFCRCCKCDTAFVGTEPLSGRIDCDEGEQLFILSFHCQSCPNPRMETFIIKRSGLKLTLCGRSPMEQIAVSKVFPKGHAKYISDATIAHNAGQTLAGLFFLRTFIEQYVTTETGKRIDDKALEAYGETLPQTIKAEIPSLLAMYGKLSEAIHEANADANLFDEAKQQLELHFDTKRIFSKLAKVKG